MDISIVRAVIPKDVRSLVAFDRKTFPSKDEHAPPSYFLDRHTRSFWLMKGRRRIGACCLKHHATFVPDKERLSRYERDTLYILSTAILPAERGKGFGDILKAWQISYARKHGFAKIVTNTRVSNAASIALNRKFGFVITEACVPDCYPDGEASTVLELILLPR